MTTQAKKGQKGAPKGPKGAQKEPKNAQVLQNVPKDSQKGAEGDGASRGLQQGEIALHEGQGSADQGGHQRSKKHGPDDHRG